ncbi:hypothetical protein [Rubinisphaera italica]|uniref:hypothetical protein n=1 Tax=Rubinisphaera italica TaxID=2527969 RepID=UPI0011B542EE|nr:hypothetical protein [Rubinisphaera italica]
MNDVSGVASAIPHATNKKTCDWLGARFYYSFTLRLPDSAPESRKSLDHFQMVSAVAWTPNDRKTLSLLLPNTAGDF